MNHLTSELIDRYRTGALDLTGELHAVESHLTFCATCRDALQQAAVSGAPALGHRLATAGRESCCLTEDALSSYVDHQADAVDREWIETHLQACPRCQAEVDDLRTWRATLPARTPVRPSTRRIPRSASVFLTACAAAIAGLGIYAGLVIPARQEAGDQGSGVRGQGPGVTGRGSDRLPTTQQSQLPVRDPQARVPTPPLKSPPSAVAVLRDGRRQITLNSGGNLSGVDDLPQEAREAIRVALQTGRVRAGSMLRPGKGRGTLLGPGEEMSFRLISPAGSAVRDVRPDFRWRTEPGPAEYRVHVVDDSSNQEVIASAPLQGESSAMEWRLPPGEAPLTRGQVYRWYVEATLPAGTVTHAPRSDEPAVRFQVLDETTLAVLRRVEAEGSSLALGLLYARAGLMDDAKHALEKLVTQNPKSALARRLLRSVGGKG